VSDQAENEATQQIVDGFKAANEAKAKLEGKMRMLGDSLAAFARTIQEPDKFVFSVNDSDSITVGQPAANLTRPLARITPAQLDWNDLCDTLRSYAKAKEDRQRNASLLRNIGIPISE
jgi:hypothetical protein